MSLDLRKRRQGGSRKCAVYLGLPFDAESQAHFDAVRQMLENLVCRLYHRYQYGARFGLLQPTRFSSLSLRLRGNDLTVCAGGRYDGLVAYFGGPETAGFGFGLGVERLLLILENKV